MKIVVLNDCFFGEEHINRLKKLGEVEIFEGTASEQQAAERIKDADIAIGDGFLTSYNEKVFSNTPNLKLLALNSTAYTIVDLESAKKHDVKIANVPGFSQESVAELIIGLMFAVVRRIPYGDRKYKESPFDPDPASPEGKEFIGFDLRGKTFGVIGLGRIGTRVAELAQGLGMKVIGYNRTPKDVPGVKSVDLETLAKESDVIAVTVIYSDETKGILSNELLQQLKSNAVVINIGKRELLDSETLYELLKENKIKGAALDWAQLEKDSPLLKLDNVVLTPHIGSYTEESFYKNLPDIIVSNVEAFIKGNPENIV